MIQVSTSSITAGPTSHYFWLELPFEQFLPLNYPIGIVMEVAALRDIQAGEELFLDYGPARESAWDKHVESWKSPTGAQDYVYPAEMYATQSFGRWKHKRPILTPKNLVTGCHTPRWTCEKGQVIEW
jgi:hypothetical protein